MVQECTTNALDIYDEISSIQHVGEECLVEVATCTLEGSIVGIRVDRLVALHVFFFSILFFF